MLDSLILYFGFAVVFIAVLSILCPLRLLRIRTRARGAIVALCGLLGVILVCALPAGTKRVLTLATKLDEWMPK